MIAAPAGAAAYLGWVQVTVRELRSCRSASNSPEAHRGGVADPFTTVAHDTADLFRGVHLGTAQHAPWAVLLVLLAAFILWKLPASYGWYAVATLAVALTASNLDSLERYGLGCFPFVVAAAMLTKGQGYVLGGDRAVRVASRHLRHAGVPGRVCALEATPGAGPRGGLPDRAACDDGAMVGLAGDPGAAALDQEGGELGVVVVVGAGPAGLTAAYQLAKTRCHLHRLRNGHGRGRASRARWRGRGGGSTSGDTVSSPRCARSTTCGTRSWDRRTSCFGRRLSRIYYNGTYFDYPIQARQRAPWARA